MRPRPSHRPAGDGGAFLFARKGLALRSRRNRHPERGPRYIATTAPDRAWISASVCDQRISPSAGRIARSSPQIIAQSPSDSSKTRTIACFLFKLGALFRGPRGHRPLRACLVTDLKVCGVARFDNPGQKVDRAGPFATLGFRWSSAGDGGAFSLPPFTAS